MNKSYQPYLCLVLLLGALTTASADDIAWHASWAQALAAAKRSQRLILAYVTTPDSDSGEQFLVTTLAAPAVVAATQEFECVRLDARGELPWPEAKEMVEEEEDEQDAPVVVFCRPDGTAHFVTAGIVPAELFIHYIGEAKRFFRMEQEATDLDRRFRGNPPTPDGRFQLGRWYMLKGGADLRSVLSAAFGSMGGLAGALGGELGKGFAFGGMALGTDDEAAEPEPPADAGEDMGPEDETGMKGMAVGLWVGMEQDEGKAKALRAKGAALLGQVRREDPGDRLGHAGEIDLLLMQNALIEERHEEADGLARRYVEKNPEGEGVALAYVVQAMASMSRMEDQQEGEGLPSFDEPKQLLEKAMEAPGDPGSHLLAGLLRVVFEMMEAIMKGFFEAFMEMGKQMQEGMEGVQPE